MSKENKLTKAEMAQTIVIMLNLPLEYEAQYIKMSIKCLEDTLEKIKGLNNAYELGFKAGKSK